MPRTRDDAPTPGSKWAILAELNEVRGEVFALRTEVDAARQESRRQTALILSHVEALTRATRFAARKAYDTMSSVDTLIETVASFSTVKESVLAAFVTMTNEHAAEEAELRTALEAARADDATSAEKSAALDTALASLARVEQATADLVTRRQEILDAVVAKTPAEAEPTPETLPVEDTSGVEPAPSEPVAEVPSEPVAEQPVEQPATDPAVQQ